MKTTTRNYDVKVDGRIFKNAERFTAYKNNSFFNSIEEQAREKYFGQDQLVKIDHASRIIILNY